MTGTLNVFSNAGTTTTTLTGTGVAPQAALNPSTAGFGNVIVGAVSSIRTFTLTNAGTASLPITSIGLSGAGASSFIVGENQCGTSLAAGGSCLIGVNFLPTSVGEAAATLNVTDSVGTQRAALTASGVLPTLTITPANLNFGAIPVGANSGVLYVAYSDGSGALKKTATSYLTGTATSSATLTPASFDYGKVQVRDTYPVLSTNYSGYGTFDIKNQTDLPLHVTSVTVSDSSQFSALGGCATTISAYNDCEIYGQFHPLAIGAAKTTLTVQTDAGTFTATLTGTGVAPSANTPFINFGKSFTTDALTLSGPANINSGALQLTAGPSSAASSAFYPTAVPASAFTSDFTFQLLDPTAEGITFAKQGNNPNAVGLGGGGLGYQGIARSLSVKFDLKDTAGEGVDSIGVYINGAAPTIPAISLASSGIDLHSGHIFDLRLNYDGTTMTINLTDTVTGAVWTTQVAEDIPAIVGGSTAYFGFTAGSGTPTLTSDAIESARAESVRPAATESANTPPPATSRILTWIYVGTGEAKTAQTITFPSLSGQTYGVAPIQLSATASSGLPVSYTVKGPAKLSGSTLTITGAGEVSVTAAQPGNANFAPASSVTDSFTVVKAPLSVTANSLSRAARAANPSLTYNFSGFVDGDSISVVSGAAVLATTAVSTSPAGKYPITFSTEGLTAANYSFNYLPGTLTISSGTLVISPAAGNFGSVKVGTTSPVISFTVTNDTASTMGYLGYTNLGEFYLQPGTCHLVNGEPMLAPGQSCVFTAVFKPATAGPVSGNLSIQTSSGIFNVPMSGAGSTLVISPSSGNFGSVNVGQTSPAMSFTVTNDTTSTTGYLGYANLGEFYLQPGTCHLVNGEPMLNPGQSCVFTAVFEPAKAGPASGTLADTDLLFPPTLTHAGSKGLRFSTASKERDGGRSYDRLNSRWPQGTTTSPPKRKIILTLQNRRYKGTASAVPKVQHLPDGFSR